MPYRCPGRGTLDGISIDHGKGPRDFAPDHQARYLCSRGRIDSGVRSRRPKPVPPEVSTRSTAESSHHSRTAAWGRSNATARFATPMAVGEGRKGRRGSTEPLYSGFGPAIRTIPRLQQTIRPDPLSRTRSAKDLESKDQG